MSSDQGMYLSEDGTTSRMLIVQYRQMIQMDKGIANITPTPENDKFVILVRRTLYKNTLCGCRASYV